jgi:RNA ligase
VFPVIEHLDEVLSAIDGREEFMVHRNPELGFVSVLYRYTMADTFLDPNETGIDDAERRRRQIVRECRGITFDAASGMVIARKFHKFFNLGERDETQPHRIDWSRPHLRLVKADGSLMTPILRGDDVRWASKMGVTRVSQPVEAFVADRNAYRQLARDAHLRGVTAQFEWCSSAAQRIILDYPESMLVLLAVRDNQTGRYWSQDDVEDFAASHGVPCITRTGGAVADHAAYVAALSGVTGIEGEVVVFDSGERYKVKTTEYIRMHKALAGLVQEKDVLALVLADGVDDVKPILSSEIAEKLDSFAMAVNQGIDHAAVELATLFRDGHAASAGDRKRFATEFAQSHKQDAPFLFALWPKAGADDEDLRASARELVARQVQKNLSSSTRVDQVRRLFGSTVRWTVEIPDLDA